MYYMFSCIGKISKNIVDITLVTCHRMPSVRFPPPTESPRRKYPHETRDEVVHRCGRSGRRILNRSRPSSISLRRRSDTDVQPQQSRMQETWQSRQIDIFAIFGLTH